VEDEMGRTCNINGGAEINTEFYSGNLKVRDHLGKQGL
jgi:hypothetical protein